MTAEKKKGTARRGYRTVPMKLVGVGTLVPNMLRRQQKSSCLAGLVPWLRDTSHVVDTPSEDPSRH